MCGTCAIHLLKSSNPDPSTPATSLSLSRMLPSHFSSSTLEYYHTPLHSQLSSDCVALIASNPSNAGRIASSDTPASLAALTASSNSPFT